MATIKTMYLCGFIKEKQTFKCTPVTVVELDNGDYRVELHTKTGHVTHAFVPKNKINSFWNVQVAHGAKGYSEDVTGVNGYIYGEKPTLYENAEMMFSDYIKNFEGER